MRRALFIALAPALLVVSGCATEGSVLHRDDGGRSGIDTGPPCVAASESEAVCGDQRDDDCDGYVDCLDPDCEAQMCRAGGFVCTGGACLTPCTGENCLPTLPPIENVRPTVRDDTAIIEFEPVAGALDYRIYPYPSQGDVLVGPDGEVAVRNAVYRCAGARPIGRREDNPSGHVDASLTPREDVAQGYSRTEAEAVLGYVYLTPGAGRVPVYRVADPQGSGGFMNADWVVPLFADANSADYVVGTEARDRLLAQGYRDDGIAFYAPSAGTRAVYRAQYAPNYWGERVALFFSEGPEHDARVDDETLVDFGERFRVHATQEPGSVPLHRVFYLAYNAHDVLAAGEARYQRTLHQGNQPLPSLTWPGLTGETTLVIEALDAGCPFPGGYISSSSAPADSGNHPSITLDQARLSSGEVFVNGQYDPLNRPRPIARALVTVSPGERPTMDWLQTFDPDVQHAPFEVLIENNGVFVMRSPEIGIDFSGCSPNMSVGPMLGQLVVGFSDYGSSCNMSLFPRGLDARIERTSYVHMRMSTDIPSTGRRYPQLMITTTPALEPSEGSRLWDMILHHRLGPLPFDLAGPDMVRGTADDAPPGDQVSLIVQPFGGYHELQVQICDQRGWGVGNQCSQANIYGHHAGNYNETWEQPWLPLPVLGELAGHDRPVQLDVYASTERIYVYVDGRPAGCAVLPEGRMPEGPVTPAFRAVLYHSDIDETVVPEDSSHQYLHEHSLTHSVRTLDDLGVELGAAAPPWDETVMPCGTRWYGG